MKDMKETDFIVSEITLALTEWGIKNNLRLFGIKYFEMVEPGKATTKPYICGYFTDPGFKSMTMLYFDAIEKTNGKISVFRARGKMGKGFKYPMKFTRTKNFASSLTAPVNPFYTSLLNRKIILPFEGTMEKKDWLALPFEDGAKIKPVSFQ